MTEETIFLDLQADTKEGIIREILDRLTTAGFISDIEASFEAIMKRENKMSTGMENGIAIPHGKTDRIDDLVAAIGRKREGVDFDSMDNKPSTIFVMTISPLSHSGPHLQFLAEVSRLLKEEETRSKLLSAQSVRDVIDIFV